MSQDHQIPYYVKASFASEYGGDPIRLRQLEDHVLDNYKPRGCPFATAADGRYSKSPPEEPLLQPKVSFQQVGPPLVFLEEIWG